MRPVGRRLRVAYLLEDTPLFGGVKVILRQADLMARRGHQVFVVSPGEAPAWFPMAASFHRTAGLDPQDVPPADVVVASYWTTISRALAACTASGEGEAVHYCQGFEGVYTHNLEEHPRIEEAYRTAIPAMAVSAHLARLVRERFGRPARVVPQPLERAFRPRHLWRCWWERWRRSRKPRILVMSPIEIDWKGVTTSLRALAELRRRGVSFTLVRLSQWPLSDAEREILEPDEFHEHLPPSAVPDLVRGCDLLLAASWEQEGFGLPVLEAMASGVPAVVSDVSCFRDWTGEAALRVPFDDVAGFADAVARVLSSRALWRRLRRRGLEVARGFHEERSAAVAEEVLQWVASGAWRQEMEGACPG